MWDPYLVLLQIYTTCVTDKTEGHGVVRSKKSTTFIPGKEVEEPSERSRNLIIVKKIALVDSVTIAKSRTGFKFIKNSKFYFDY